MISHDGWLFIEEQHELALSSTLITTFLFHFVNVCGKGLFLILTSSIMRTVAALVSSLNAQANLNLFSFYLFKPLLLHHRYMLPILCKGNLSRLCGWGDQAPTTPCEQPSPSPLMFPHFPNVALLLQPPSLSPCNPNPELFYSVAKPTTRHTSADTPLSPLLKWLSLASTSVP